MLHNHYNCPAIPCRLEGWAYDAQERFLVSSYNIGEIETIRDLVNQYKES